MCNFVIRPIKSYATVAVKSIDQELEIKRGDHLDVQYVDGIDDWDMSDVERYMNR